MKKRGSLILICSTLIVCISILVYFITTLPMYKKSTTSLEVNNIENGVFENINDSFLSVSGIAKAQHVNLQSRNLKFVFNNDIELINFRCEVKVNDKAYELYSNGEKVYFKEVLEKHSLAELDLNHLFKCFDKINYTYLLDYLKEGEQYTFTLYPQKSINNAGYIYNTEKYGNASFFIYKDNVTHKLSDKKYHTDKNTLLFSLSSMKQSYDNNSNQGYHPIDKVFIIIPYE